VADGEDRHEDAGARLRCEHDRQRDAHHGDRPRFARPALGEQEGERHYDGVGQRGGDVRGLQVQAEELDEQGDLGQFLFE
jgi:hypothetical protein